MKKHQISTKFLSIEKVAKIVARRQKIELSQEAIDAVQKCRAYLDKKTDTEKEPIYGVTTGFGSLCNRSISKEDLSTLQRNLVVSHACGVGAEVPQEIVQLMLLMKIQSLSYGHSGVQLATVQRLVDFYNKGVYPVVYQQGSLGASGDLAPLAHLSLPLINMGEVYYRGKKYPASVINEKFGWEPITLQSKEGLALLNGTQFMSSYAVWLLIKSQKLSWLADIIGAVSLDAFDGRIEPFNLNVHLVRPHAGQLITAAHFQELLQGSELIQRHKEHVQDPYSFRCIPQVHGATKDSIQHVLDVELSGYRIMATLMELMVDAIEHPERYYSQQLIGRVSSQYDIENDDLETRLMAVIDYISGMTDVYALDVYQKICGISLPIV